MDINKIMSSLGMESFTGEEHLTEEQEMLNEIALEAELDTAFAEMDAANTVVVVSDVHAINCGLAEREIALESNIGREADVIMKEFGLEAIKDVAARHAYTGIANIKALINKVIAWFKNLLGMGTTLKKIAKSLETKAKNDLKALNKYAGRNMEKLKRTMPTGTTLQEVTNLDAADDVAGKDLTALGSAGLDANTIKTSVDTLKDAKEKLTDTFKEWKDATDEYEGVAAFNHVRDLVKAISTWAGKHKSDEGQKKVKKAISDLEKLRKQWNEDAANEDKSVSTAKNDLAAALNQKVIQLNEVMSLIKLQVKIATKQADEILTHSKGVQAAL